MFVWNAGVHDHSRVVVLFIEGHRIDFAAPAFPHDLEIFFGITARSHGPYDFLQVGWINIVVHDDGPAVPVRHRHRLAGQDSGLAGVTVILLLDTDDIESPAGAGFVGPDS